MVRLHAWVPAFDVALAGVLTVVAIVTQAADRTLPQPWVTVVAAVWSASVVLRTVAPMAMVELAAASAVGYALFPVHTTLLVSFPTLLLVGFFAGERLRGRRLLVAVALLVASVYVVQILTSTRPGGDTAVGDVFVSPVLLVTPVLGGMLLRRSRRQTAELRRLGEQLASEREAHARAAAAAERNRIARELHDVISHSVSVMVVQAAAAEQQLPADSPAREQILAIRRTGRDALAELRRQLGVLREGPEESPAPMPGLADVTRLADEDDGARVSVDYDAAALGDLPPGLALTAYRVVQEALTNARKHAAGAPVRVRVGRDDRGPRDGLALDVVNGPGQALLDQEGDGHGLAGMHERVTLYAGHLEAGRTEDGGWQVRARLPIPPGSAS